MAAGIERDNTKLIDPLAVLPSIEADERLGWSEVPLLEIFLTSPAHYQLRIPILELEVVHTRASCVTRCLEHVGAGVKFGSIASASVVVHVAK